MTWIAGKSSLRRTLAGPRALQVGSLYFAMASSLGIGFVTSVINTRSLGPHEYGDLKFIGTVFLFLSTISSLGLFSTGSQALAEMQDEGGKRRELVGTLIAVAGVISGAFTLVAVIFSFIEPYIFANDLRVEILLFSPMVGLFIFQLCIENILQGENRIHELSAFSLMPGLLFMLLLAAGAALHWLTLTTTLLLQLTASAVAVYVALRRLRPVYPHLMLNSKLLWRANKSYGWFVYVGILSAVATGYLSTFTISYYLDNANVGYFSLAVTLTMPLTQVSSVVGTTYFREFAHRENLPGKVTIVMVLLAGVTLILFLFVIRPLVTMVYTEKFVEVASLASILAVGAVLHGIGDYFNRFLGAHALGKELRNGAMASGIVSVLGYLFLVKLIGVHGAAWTKLLASSTYCGLMVTYYWIRFRKGGKLGIGAGLLARKLKEEGP